MPFIFQYRKKTQFFTNSFRERFLPVSMQMVKNEIYIFLLIGCSQKRETPEVKCQHTDHIDMLKDFIFIHRYLFGLHWLFIYIRLCKHRKKVFYCFYKITFPRKKRKTLCMALIKREILTSRKILSTKSCTRNQFSNLCLRD